MILSYPLPSCHMYLSFSFSSRTISLVVKALVGWHCVKRLARGHRVCSVGRYIRPPEGRGFDSFIVHTLIFWITCWILQEDRVSMFNYPLLRAELYRWTTQ